MKAKMLLLSGSAVALAGAAFAASHSNMADSMTLVSWGGAYQASQQKAYVEPYQAMNEGVEAVWDESSNEAVAKLRAMNEAGNVTWDLVDVVASDAIRLCDEGLAMEIDHDEMLAPAPDGTSASDDFGDLIVSDCFIPQIVYSTTAAYLSLLVQQRFPLIVCPRMRHPRAAREKQLPERILHRRYLCYQRVYLAVHVGHFGSETGAPGRTRRLQELRLHHLE